MGRAYRMSRLVALISLMAASFGVANATNLAAPAPDLASADHPTRAAGETHSIDDAQHRSLLAKQRNARPDFDYYSTKSDALDSVRAIVDANPRTMRLETMTASQDGYASELLVVTVEPNGLDTPPTRGTEKTRALYNYGEHGRELITVQVALKLLAQLAKGVDHASTLSHKSLGREETAAALKDVVLKIVPMENVNGRTKVESGDWCERKNGRGVDTNRNWAVDWGVKEADFDPYEEYPGKAPFSEPEARMLKSLVETFKPHAWVNVHSGMEAMFMPYDHKPSEPSGAGAAAMRNVLKDLNAFHCGGRCVVGGGGKGVGYLAHGTATDWVYEAANVPVAFTWEIYGDDDAHYMDCFRMFNPVGREAHDSVVNDWVSAGVSLLPMLARHPDLPSAGLGADVGGGSSGVSGGGGSDDDDDEEPAGGSDDEVKDSEDDSDDEDEDGATQRGPHLRGDASPQRIVQRAGAFGSGVKTTGLGTKGFGYHLVDGIDRDVPARMDKIKAAQRLGGLRVDKYASSEDDWSTGVVRTGGYALVGLFVCCVIVPRWRRARFVRRNASKGHVRRSPK
jgi:hypothetical protein